MVFVEDFLDGYQGGFGIERVEDGFYQEYVDSAGDEGAGFVFVGGFDLIEGDYAEACVVGVGGVGEGDGQGSYGSGYETLA